MPRACPAEEFVRYEAGGPIHASSFINSLVVPRPIALVTTVGRNGVVNAAPFSYFNIACTNPPMVSIAIERRRGERKDSARNIVERGEFVVNVCSVEMAKGVSIAGGDFPPEVSEIELAGLSLLPSVRVGAPRVANCLAQIECTLFQTIELGLDPTDLILGKIVEVHVHRSVIGEGGKIEIGKLNPLARLAGSGYAKLTDYFNIPRGIP